MATFVCQHLLQGFGKGFYAGFDDEYPDDPFPDAWCEACDKKLSEVGEWNDESEEFADIRVICAHCYANVRLRNQPEEERRRFTLSHIEDAEEKHREAPRTFSIPRSDEREQLQPGALVKLHFHLAEKVPGAPEAERMWVEVLERLPDRRYRGKLTNQPFFLKDVARDDVLEFSSKQITAVYSDPETNPWIDESLFLNCDSAIINSDGWPEFAYREEPINERDSGWRVFASEEQQQSVKLTQMQLAELLEAFPVLDSIFGEPVGSRWSWDNEELEYRRAD